jgi:hypothetical protein
VAQDPADHDQQEVGQQEQGIGHSPSVPADAGADASDRLTAPAMFLTGVQAHVQDRARQ